MSHYQGTVDWDVLANEKINIAYIKATEGSSHVDPCFMYNWEQSEKTTLRTGAYHFFSFDSEGKTQAENFIKNVAMHDNMLPPAIDVEFYADKKNNPPEPEAVREQLKVMLNEVQNHYQMTPVIYSTEEFWKEYLEGEFNEYPLWIRNVFTKPRIAEKWTLWQYTNRGRLEGYTGEEEFIDLNVFNGDEKAWEEWLKANK